MYIESKDDKNYGITKNLDKIKTKNITIKTNKSTKMPLFMPH